MSELKTELGNMEVGERITCGDSEIMCMPGGWLVTQHFNNNSTTTFVPDPGGPLTRKKASVIQLQ